LKKIDEEGVLPENIEDPVTPRLKGLRRPEEPDLENLPKEWAEEELESERRKPDLGELDDDPEERGEQ